MGSSHLAHIVENTTKGIPGIAEMQGVPSIVVENKSMDKTAATIAYNLATFNP